MGPNLDNEAHSHYFDSILLLQGVLRMENNTQTHEVSKVHRVSENKR